MIEISFNNESDRTRGIGTLFRSKFGWSGTGHNKFIVRDEHIQLLKENKIGFKIQ